MAIAKSPVKRFFDHSFLNKEVQLNLQLQISNRYIYAAFLQAKDNRFVGFEEYYLGENDRWEPAYESIREIISGFNQNYKKTSIAIIDACYTLVPTPLFDPEAALDYLKLNHHIGSSQLSVQHNEVESMSTTVTYAFPERLNQMLKKQFPSFQLLHYTVPLMEYIGIQKGKGKSTLQLHIQYDHFEVIYIEKGKLSFFNRFNYQTVEDFIYYLLYVIEQLQLDREQLQLELFGEFEKQSAIYEMLFKYIRNIHIQQRPKEMKYAAVLSELPSHQYLNLFNQYLCA